MEFTPCLENECVPCWWTDTGKTSLRLRISKAVPVTQNSTLRSITGYRALDDQCKDGDTPLILGHWRLWRKLKVVLILFTLHLKVETKQKNIHTEPKENTQHSVCY